MSKADELISKSLLESKINLPHRVAKGEKGIHFETGKPVEFPYIHNKEPAPDMGERFGQHLEPAGKFMVHTGYHKNLQPNTEAGVHRFDNPLVIAWGTTSGEPHGWKSKLSKAFGGKTGASLSKAIRNHGHDGVVTVGSFRGSPDVSEIVALKK